MDLLASPAPFDLTDPRWAPESTFYEWLPAQYSTEARIGDRVVEGRDIVSSGAQIERASVVNCVLSPRSKVGTGSELEECVLFAGAEVGEGARLRKVIVEENVRVSSGARIGFGDDSDRFTTSPGGVAVVSSSYRFSTEQESEAVAVR